MDKRYQVFVSSTFDDLREERATVISALLQLDCFPAGMELFPAADDDSLTLIRSVIDDSDYYLIILGGRYGTVDKGTGKSYTHLEYEYALATGKPTIALLHSDPGSLAAHKTEGSDEGRKRFDDFRSELRNKNCRHWSDLSELLAAVFTGIQHLKRTRPAQGWVRASDSTDEKLKDEILRLRRELETMSSAVEVATRRNPPVGTEELARGRESMEMLIEFPEGKREDIYVAWENVFRTVLPLTLGSGADNHAIAAALVSLARESAPGGYRANISPADWESAALSASSLGTIINQMVALGFIEATQPPSSPTTVWQATPYGAQEGCRQVAVRTRLRRSDSREQYETAEK